jgi:hypothetical protein
VGVTRAMKGHRIALVLTAALACTSAAAPAAAADCTGLTGEYLYDHYDNLLKPELQAQLGDVFQRWEDRYDVQVPFESTGDGYVYAAGCKAHSCTIDEAFLGIEEATCTAFVALLENEQYTLVLPDAQWPASLYDARQAWISR